MFDTTKERRENYIENVGAIFRTTADLYYEHWGEFFHLAIFGKRDDPTDFDGAFERTHERYFKAIRGTKAKRILELASGGGAFSAWMAERTRGEVVGVDISDTQLAHARKRLAKGKYPNLRFIQHDIMHIADLDEPLFDAAVCMDAACYLPDKRAALKGIASRLRRGARFLLIDWCRPRRLTALQKELILEPFYRYWSIPDMQTIKGYEQSFAAAGFRMIKVEDLSLRVELNWERGYQAGIEALAGSISAAQLVAVAKNVSRYGSRAVRFAKDQFNAAVFAKVAADAGLLRYVYFLGERS